MPKKTSVPFTCSFCGKLKDEVRVLIEKERSRIPANICDFCVVDFLDKLGQSEEFSENERERLQKNAFELRKLLYTTPLHPL